MTLAWDAEDRILARSIFGTDDPDRVVAGIREWAADRGFGPVDVTAVELSIGAAATLATADGRLFLKVWPGSIDAKALAAQMRVQRRMRECGFPAPAVLTEPLPLDGSWAVAMAYDRPGDPADAAHAEVRRAMAAGLARLVATAEDCRMLAELPARSLPAKGAIWPRPHNTLFDFGSTERGAEWIDALGADALAAMRAEESRMVVGHCDWSARNLRMRGTEIAIVYDWDSVFLERETIVVGSAAAQVAPAPMAAFVRDYEAARGTPFVRSERVAIVAAASYSRAYDARCEHALDPSGHLPSPARDALRACPMPIVLAGNGP